MSVLRELATDPRLGAAHAFVLDIDTGEVLFDLHGDTPAPTASVMKVLTSVAALEILGPEYRATTRVVEGAESDEVVLVGGGDVTLSRLPTGASSFYPGAAHLDNLAYQVRQSRLRTSPGVPIRKLTLDASLFSGPLWLDTWDELEERVSDGSMPYVTALQVDGDRDDPVAGYSPRSADPVRRAGEAFADLLDADIELVADRAPAGAAELGRVYSLPVRELVRYGLLTSDNVMMEMLARLSAISAGNGNDFDAIHPTVLNALSVYSRSTLGVRIADGSGLSELSIAPPRFLAELMARVWRRDGSLGIIADSLPQSGPRATGTLGDRFSEANAVVGDAVHAKTGWIIGSYTMAGYLRSRAGRNLAFAVFALGDVDHSAREAIDSFVAGIFLDGDYGSSGSDPEVDRLVRDGG